MLDRGKWILYDILDIQVGPYLVEMQPEVWYFSVREHHELQLRRSFVVVKLVFSRPIGYEAEVESASPSVTGREKAYYLLSSPPNF